MEPVVVPVPNPTTSFWLDGISDTDCVPSIHSLPTDVVDICIIGAGMSGISVAYHLSNDPNGASQSIVVLDARGISECATGRNGGHCWPSVKLPSEEEIQQYGLEQLQRAQKLKFECADMMVNFVKEQNIDCDLVEGQGAITVARFEAEAHELKEHLRELNEMGMNYGEAVFWEAEEARTKLHSDTVCGAIFQPKHTAQFWPAKFVRAVATLAHNNGVSFCLHTPVQHVERATEPDSPAKLIILTSKGTIRARRVVYATNGYTASLVQQLQGFIFPVRGQVVATEPQQSWYFPSNLSINDGYEYMIQRKADNRIILGGMRWRAESASKEVTIFDDSTLDPLISCALRDMFSQIFSPLYPPGQGPNIDKEWTGVMGFTKDEKPLVGPLDESGDQFILAGFNGNGMVRCWACGKAVAEMMLGHLNPDDWITPLSPLRLRRPEVAALRERDGIDIDGE